MSFFFLAYFQSNKVYLSKLNVILVLVRFYPLAMRFDIGCSILPPSLSLPLPSQIVKQEWPLHWASFIDDIVGASKTSEPLCTNNMSILKLLRYRCTVALGMTHLVSALFNGDSG